MQLRGGKTIGDKSKVKIEDLTDPNPSQNFQTSSIFLNPLFNTFSTMAQRTLKELAALTLGDEP